MRLVLAALLASGGGVAASPPPPAATLAQLQQRFAEPPDDSRPMMRWWWFGAAVTPAGIERELGRMKEGGIGGVEIQAVYPLVLDDPARGVRNLPFLSDGFLEALRVAARVAASLGLRVDLTLGSGWPYGGPQVGITQAAGRLRVERVPAAPSVKRVAVPDIGAGETLIATFLVSAADPLAARELAASDGLVALPDQPGAGGEVLFFIASRTGMMVKRPAVGAEGFVVDHYDRPALESYLRETGDRLLSAFAPGAPYAVFCDSLEVYESDWTPDFLSEFRARRGYDLRPLLPALVRDDDPRSGAVRGDWGRTLSELLDEHFMAPLRDWAHAKGTLLRAQAYGLPPATIASNARVDLAEGEGYQWKALRASRWAASANHLFDRAVTSSETWTWLHSPAFRATPLDLKAEADLHFLQGVNQLIGHGWPYTPEGMDYPGARFYAAGAFHDANPWWLVMPDLARYLQRTSFLLRQGEPVADVAVYLPDEDVWASFAPGRVSSMIDALATRIGPDVIARVLEAGYGLDVFDDGTLGRIGRVEAGALVLGSRRYRAVVLPSVERIPVGTLRTLETLARQGGLVIATRRVPDLAPGFGREAETAQVRALSGLLFGAAGRGRSIADEGQLGRTLTDALRPDVAWAPAAPDVGFVHRRVADADVYFLANTSNVRQSVAGTFRVSAPRAQWWDAMTGRVSPAAAKPARGGGMAVEVALEPYASRFLVFTTGSLAYARPPAVASLPDPVDISPGWTVRFGSAGPAVAMPSLHSWADDEATREFSGVATYEREVTVPPSFLRPGTAVMLDFGETRPLPAPSPKARMQALLDAPVREAAVVEVNGRRAGSVWCPPYAIEITPLLRAGANTLRIAVGNLAINRMASRAQPDYRLLRLRYGVRFEPQDMEGLRPLPAGLLGPIRLVPRATD